MKKVILISMLVIAVVIFALSQTSKKTPTQTPTPTPETKHTPYVLKANEGENIGRGGIIKVSPQTGAKNLSMVVQQLPKSKKINVHMHEHDEEVFFVHKGKGTVTLNDKQTKVEEGGVVFIPPGTWHGFEAEDDMHLVWLVSPPHFVDLYRLFFKPGFEPTKEEADRLLQKYGYKEKPPK